MAGLNSPNGRRQFFLSESRINAYLVCPFNLLLISSISLHRRQNDKPFNMKKIIVAEDDPAIGDILQLILEGDGYQVEVFVDGDSMMESKLDPPDLFLLDRQLINSDGLEVCRRLKSRDTTSNIPVIILSASDHVAEMARSAGANAFLEKPFTMQRLRDLVARYV